MRKEGTAISHAVDVCARCGDANTAPAAAPATTCPVCHADAPARIPFGSTGRVYSWTTVHRGMPGVPVPYTLAYADFDGGVRLFARVTGAVDVGTEVSVRPTDGEAGEFRLAPLGSAS